MPISAVIGFWPWVDTVIQQSGLPVSKVFSIVICVTSKDQYSALEVLADRIIQITDSASGELLPIKKIESDPLYKYYRISQVAQAVGDNQTGDEMLKRPEKMRYKGAMIYRPSISDIKIICKYIAPTHEIRQGVMMSIVRAHLDKKLDWQVSNQISKLMGEDDGFEKEICDADDIEIAARPAAKKV